LSPRPAAVSHVFELGQDEREALAAIADKLTQSAN
jgi:hypothetical protein